MRILSISNFFPPHYVGGYELGCADVMDGLSRRGHQIGVLTGQHGVDVPTREGDIFRWLRLAPRVVSGKAEIFQIEKANQRALGRAVQIFRPTHIHIWNLGRLSLSLALRAEQIAHVSYYVSDQWIWDPDVPDPLYSELRAPHADLRSRFVRPLLTSTMRMRGLLVPRRLPAFKNVAFCSAFLRDAGAAKSVNVSADSLVIHWGIDTRRFAPSELGTGDASARKRLLYVGQLVPHKGLHTVIEALGALRQRGVCDLTLSIVGGSLVDQYEKRLRGLVQTLALSDVVTFVGKIDRSQLPDIYRRHGTLVLPSCWDEPFAITPLEAMASGVAVVATTRGGSREIFEHGVNALTFAANDNDDCAAQLLRIRESPELWRSLVDSGLRTVRERFTLSMMIDRLEAQLETSAPDYSRSKKGRRAIPDAREQARAESEARR